MRVLGVAMDQLPLLSTAALEVVGRSWSQKSADHGPDAAAHGLFPATHERFLQVMSTRVAVVWLGRRLRIASLFSEAHAIGCSVRYRLGC
jgi:hypothetical protein